MKRAVIYYSLTSNTKEAAESIAKQIGAELYRMETVKPMPVEKEKQMLVGGMQATFGMKPKVKGIPEQIDTFDELILGTPIWAGKNAPAINTLLKSKDVKNKITAVFTFSGGGDNDSCIQRLQKKLPNLKYTVALADRQNELASENADKLASFVDKIK